MNARQLIEKLGCVIESKITTSQVRKIFDDYCRENEIDPDFKVWEPGAYDKEITGIVVTIDGVLVDFFQEGLISRIDSQLKKLGYYLEPWSSSVLIVAPE